jgi:DNA gyrase subunit A
VYQIPEASRVARGKAVVNLVSLQAGEKIKAILPVREFKENEYVLMVTRAGIIKKTALSEFKNVRAVGLSAISVDEGDELVSAKLTQGSNDVFLCSHSGMSIRFNEEDVRPTGRGARGVIAMNLDQGDQVVAIEVLSRSSLPGQGDNEVLIVTDNGYGKRTPVQDYRLQGRGGSGVIAMRSNEKNGLVMGCRQVVPKDDLMLVSNKGQMIRIKVGEISEQGRTAQGVRLISLAPNEKLVSIELLAENVADSETAVLNPSNETITPISEH